jgi:hypothetical protein
MSWSINDGVVVFSSFEFPEGNVNGNSSFSLSLKLVQYPGVFEGCFSKLLGFLLELFDGSLIDTSTFVDQVASSGRFSGIYVSNDDNINVSLFFSHDG